MVKEEGKFGAFIRRKREARKIGLREMAKKLGVSPTYMSKIERDEFPPPVEGKVRAIAQIIECDADELLALAGRVSSDLSDIIKSKPITISALLRTVDQLTDEQVRWLLDEIAREHPDLAIANVPVVGGGIEMEEPDE